MERVHLIFICIVLSISGCREKPDVATIPGSGESADSASEKEISEITDVPTLSSTAAAADAKACLYDTDCDSLENEDTPSWWCSHMRCRMGEADKAPASAEIAKVALMSREKGDVLGIWQADNLGWIVYLISRQGDTHYLAAMSNDGSSSRVPLIKTKTMSGEKYRFRAKGWGPKHLRYVIDDSDDLEICSVSEEAIESHGPRGCSQKANPM